MSEWWSYGLSDFLLFSPRSLITGSLNFTIGRFGPLRS